MLKLSIVFEKKSKMHLLLKRMDDVPIAHAYFILLNIIFSELRVLGFTKSTVILSFYKFYEIIDSSVISFPTSSILGLREMNSPFHHSESTCLFFSHGPIWHYLF